MNVMLLNGLPIEGPSLELYSLLDKIAAEVRTHHHLPSSQVSPSCTPPCSSTVLRRLREAVQAKAGRDGNLCAVHVCCCITHDCL